MARPGAIPTKLYDAIMDKVADNTSVRGVVAWLEAEHRVKTSSSAVQRVIEKKQKERAEVSRALVTERLSRTITSDLDRLESRAKQVDEILDGLAEGMVNGKHEGLTEVIGRTPRPVVFAQVLDRQLAIVALKMKLSGADGGGGAGGPGGPITSIPPESTD